MTVKEFMEAMETEAMQQEFAAFAAQKQAKTMEEIEKALAEFITSKGVEAPAGAQQLSDEALEGAAGGGFFDDVGDFVKEAFYKTAARVAYCILNPVEP